MLQKFCRAVNCCAFRFMNNIALIVHCRIDVYIKAWTKNADLQPVITKIIKQELIAVFIQALHRNE